MTAQATPALQIDLTPVVSGNLKAIGFDAATETLDVQFASGLIDRYSGVPAKTHQALIGAESVGGFFAKNVRTRFASEKLEDLHEGSTPD